MPNLNHNVVTDREVKRVRLLNLVQIRDKAAKVVEDLDQIIRKLDQEITALDKADKVAPGVLILGPQSRIVH